MGRRNDRGSALLITVIMIVVMVSMVGLLLAAPNAQLAQVASSSAKEKSLEAADAGVRDAIGFIMAYKPNIPSWMPDPASVGGTPTYIYVTGTGGSWTTISPSPSPSPNAAFTGVLVNTSSAGLFGTNGIVNFASTNYVGFGDSRSTSSQYAYAIIPRGNGYYEVQVSGAALTSQLASTTGTKTVVSIIDAYIHDPTPTTNNPGAVTFANPNGSSILNASTGTAAGWTNIDPTTYTNAASNPPTAPMVYLSEKGGGSDKVSNTPAAFITGTDTATTNPTNTSGMVIQSGTVQMDNTQGVSAGSPPVGSGNSTVFSTVQNIVTQVSGMSGGGITNVTWSGSTISLGNTSPAIVYVKIPANTTVSTNVFNFNGNSTFNGILILDVGNNVTFNFSLGSAALFNFNGNPNNLKGAFIFNQQGTITVPSTGIYLSDDKGNATSKLDWNSTNYQKALANLKIQLKLSAYRIVE